MTVDYGPCPKCGGKNFKVWRFPHPVVLHWMLNPGLVVNELLLGMRVPRVQLFCQQCPLPLVDRAYIPCDKCGVLNSGRSWSRRDAFFHWLGIVCPKCGLRIASLWNVFSLLILTITSPIWYLPYRLYFLGRPVRSPEPLRSFGPITPRAAVAMAVGWGLLMWLALSWLPLAWRFYRGDPLEWGRVWVGLVACTFGGAFFGFAMERLLNRKLGPPSN
jgi:Zn finger protein HypA/HybF involved in hydrogenase expression